MRSYLQKGEQERSGARGGPAARAQTLADDHPRVSQLRMMEERANSSPNTQRTAVLQAMFHRGARQGDSPGTATLGPGPSGAVVQRTVEEDLDAMQLGGQFQSILANSSNTRTLFAKANALNVRIAWGGTHPQTQRQQGSNGIRVTVPSSASGFELLEAIIFELNNAVRQDRFDALSQKAVSGEIADEDEFAREKIKVELGGMINTGTIAAELKAGGMQVPFDRFFIPTFLGYRNARTADPFLTGTEYIASKADEVLDRPHGKGSHRQVYTGQFRAFANPQNKAPREQNQKLKTLAGQALSISKLTSLEYAAEKLWRETPYGPEVEKWLERQQEATRWRPLHEAFENHRMKTLAQSLNAATATGSFEEQLQALGPEKAKALYAWIERNDTGDYRNLSQLLGLYLGYYDNHPEQLTRSIY